MFPSNTLLWVEAQKKQAEFDYNLEDAIISLFDLNGRRVLNYKNSSNNNIVDISSLSDGEYVLRVILSEGGIYSTKVLKR